jgi:hypothetical protein
LLITTVQLSKIGNADRLEPVQHQFGWQTAFPGPLDGLDGAVQRQVWAAPRIAVRADDEHQVRIGDVSGACYAWLS